MQEYCRQTYHQEAVPVKSCKDLQAFYDWFVTRVKKNDTGELVVGRSWKHIASMVYFHGYVTPEEWREGGFTRSKFKQPLHLQAGYDASGKGEWYVCACLVQTAVVPSLLSTDSVRWHAGKRKAITRRVLSS